jgi:tripartite-type tricarboxylate transporter receptor subunit TctC
LVPSAGEHFENQLISVCGHRHRWRGHHDFRAPSISALAAGAAALLALSPIARAQTYPTRPITLIVPFSPGGGADAIARIVVERIRASLGQPIVIEIVAGANGSIGTGRAARATPDGYTLLVGLWNTHVANGVLYSLPYDLLKDFEPISLLASNPELILQRKVCRRMTSRVL